jgi:phosphoglycolate phosphatase
MFRFQGLEPFTPTLVVFDKDGTLIDFNFMWASWIKELARRLLYATQQPITDLLYQAMGYDDVNARVIAGGPLAVCSMKTLRDITVDVVWRSGFSRAQAEQFTNDAWFVPDPVALARPVADPVRVFAALYAQNIHLAVATSDDRAPTLATLDALGLSKFIEAIVCADDGLPNKPAPDMLLHLCHILDIPPAQTMMVGDAVADMEMGRNANVARVIGVTTGLTDASQFISHADYVIQSISNLLD